MSKKPGGRRQGAGRKPLDPSLKKRPITVWLSPDEQAYCLQLGDTVPAGIRQLILEGMNHAGRRQVPPCEPQ